MSSTVNLTLSKSGYVKSTSANTVFRTNTSTWYEITDYPDLYYLYMGFNAMPNNLRHNKLLGVRVRVQIKTSQSPSNFFSVNAIGISSDFDPNTLTYNNRPLGATEDLDTIISGTVTSDFWLENSIIKSWQIPLFVRYGIYLNPTKKTDQQAWVKTVLSGGGSPYLEVTYDESVKATSKVVYKSGAKSGYLNPRNASTFQWDLQKANESVYCADDNFTQASATFYWKASADANYTAVSVSGSTKSVTIPANTFPTAETISWYVSATDTENTTTQTEVFSFSTAAGTAYAQLIEPSRSVEDGSAPITLNWVIGSTDGQPASRTVLQWKTESGSQWTTLTDSPTQLTSFTVPGGTFPAGTIEWRVTPYNIDGIAGTTGTTSFVSVAAPDPVQGLAATSVPFSTISWQSTGQEAYQIAIDGNVIVKAYGPTVYTYQLEEPLPDGDHTIAVTIQGIYGLWSQPSEITVSIQNTPTDTITLSGDFDVDAVLFWDIEQDLTYIYRDGKRIGATTGQTFLDRLSLGQHNYYVLSPLPDGNYNISDTISGTTTVECSKIALLSGGGWLTLEHCKELPIQTYTRNRTVSVRHYCGAVYPVAEVSTYFDRSGNFNVLFEDGDDALVEKLESLMGEIVVMKNRRNNLLVGIFSTLDKIVQDYCVECNFIVQQTEWKDFVDETNN